MALPSFLQPCLASYDLSKIDKGRDKKTIITEILNKGDDQALTWLGKTYTLKEIKEVVASPTRGMWMKSILTYWMRIFNVRLPRQIFQRAIVDLNP